MPMLTSFEVDRADLSDTHVQAQACPSEGDLQDGQVLLKIGQFALTANNITYAAIGEKMRYWEFFPASSGKGVIPVWGFADVIASRKEGVDVGERFYGYYPMATHLVVEPNDINANSFMDNTEHRRALAIIYNQYLRCSADPLYSEQTEALQMLLRPLFTTSFLLDDFFADNEFFGAETILLTSASSKTALGMAFALQHNRQNREQNYEVVGLTSPGNVEFVEGLGCYDRVLSYEQLSELDTSVPAATVDFAGNGELLGRLHTDFNEQLKYSCLVGASHWDQRGGLPRDLPGAKPILFFAPYQAEKRIKEWGGAGFQKRLADVWLAFIEFVQGWMKLEEQSGVDAVEAIYQDVLACRFKPDVGYVLSLWDEQ